MKNRTYYIALSAVMFALIQVAMIVDRAIISFLPISMALLTLLVTFSFMFVDKKFIMALLAGTFMGLASLLKAIMYPTPPVSVLNINPLVSVLPRIIMAIAAYLTYLLMLRLCRNMTSSYRKHYVSITVAVFVALVTNTVCYLTALNIAKSFSGMDTQALFVTIKLIIYTNIIPEYAVSILFVPKVALSVRKNLKIDIECKEIV